MALNFTAAISIHAPAWGATHTRPTPSGHWPFQFTPPRGGRHENLLTDENTQRISIHAPAWGATSQQAPHEIMQGLFQFTPPRGGATCTPPLPFLAPFSFQFTPPRGGRLEPGLSVEGRRLISIHAPAWGATEPLHGGLQAHVNFNSRPRVGGDFYIQYGAKPGQYFNSRPRVGGDPCSPACRSFSWEFQFTPPRGGRQHEIVIFLHGHMDFNSRPRVGGDQMVDIGEKFKVISIHAPAWGATKWWILARNSRLFQFTPPRGGRLFRYVNENGDGVFQFTPPRGGRQPPRERQQIPPNFNSRPRVGGDTIFTASCGGSSYFNSRPRVGGDRLWIGNRSSKSNFNSRPRVGGDLLICPPCGRRTLFQFTPPRGGRHYKGLVGKVKKNGFQFTPPRGGRPMIGTRYGSWSTISIHAPAWGATRDGMSYRGRKRISIHAPAWGATGSGGTGDSMSWKFQFTPPRGGRRPVLRRRCPQTPYFNSRPRVGGDFPGGGRVERGRFQFTPPRGGRQPCCCTPGTPTTFQFTPPRGGRPVQ